VSVKTFIMLQNTLFQINAILLNFLKTPENICITVFTKKAAKPFSTLIIIRKVSNNY